MTAEPERGPDPWDGGDEETPQAIQRRRRIGALLTLGVVVAAIAVALGVGHLDYPTGGGGGVGPLPPLPTTVPGSTGSGTPDSATTLPPAFAATGTAALRVLVTATAPAGGPPLSAMVTLDNETGHPIAAPGRCVGWLHVGLSSPGHPYAPALPAVACAATMLPRGVSQYRVAISATLPAGTYTVVAADLPPPVHLLEPPTVTLQAG